MKTLFNKGSILILLGTGGVGKTTVAAALGLAAAARHLDTALITVDPARRLRDALGMEHLGGQPVRLDSKHLRSAGLDPGLKLSATMLDVKGAWDALVERFAHDGAARKRILSNPFYRSLTGQFAGSEAFAALQQLYDLHQGGNFEMEIVDTPPAAHAFEFLEAPARFIRLLDSGTARWLFTPSLSAGRLAVKLASRAARFVVRELERFAGGQVLSTISDFFVAASETVDAVVDRLRKTQALMRSPAVQFILVTTPEEDRIRQARELASEMRAGGLRLAAVVVNRFLDQASFEELVRTPGTALVHLEDIPKLREVLSPQVKLRAGLNEMLRFFENYREDTLEELDRVARFARELPADVKLAVAPEMRVGVRDLGALMHLADYLTAGASTLRAIETAASRGSRRRTA